MSPTTFIPPQSTLFATIKFTIILGLHIQDRNHPELPKNVFSLTSEPFVNMAVGWRKLNVGVIGGGIGGMSVPIALRRAGHDVVIYERSDFAGEVGASVSCAANGTRWLHEWGVDVAKGDPVVLKKLINRDWKTGEPVSEYSLDDYEERWGHVYNMFHRQYMHAILKESALGEGKGSPARLEVNHKV